MQKKNKSNFLKKIFLIFILTLSLVLPFSFAPTNNVKAEESDPLQGTWVWNDTINDYPSATSSSSNARPAPHVTINVSYVCDNVEYTYINLLPPTYPLVMYYNSSSGHAYGNNGGWRNELYKTIEISSTFEEISVSGYGNFDFTPEGFLTWLQANATKQEEIVEPDIASGEYRVNYNYSWPLTETVEFTGGLTYNDVSYGSLFLGAGEIYLLSYGTTATQKNIMNNYQWLVDSFTFTAPEGLYNTNEVHNAVESFNSQVNGELNENLGLSLGSTQYSFNPTIDYNTLGYVEFDMPFRTGREFELVYNYMYYSTALDTLYYGGREEENIVYQNGVWVSYIYKNFMCESLITNYAVGNFLAQNLDIYQLNENYYIKGYYYFNDSIRVSDLLDLSFLSDFTYIHNGIIYDSFLPTYNVITSNGVVSSYTIVLDFYNTNTTKRTTLLSGQYTDPSTFISTNNNFRQIYISPTMVNYDTYNWLNDNGLWIYYSDAEQTELGDLFLVFPDVVIHFLASVLSFELFGIDVYTAICSILTVILAVWLIRKLL